MTQNNNKQLLKQELLSLIEDYKIALIKVRDLYFTIEKKVQKESDFSQDEAELLLYEKFREAMKKSYSTTNNNITDTIDTNKIILSTNTNSKTNYKDKDNFPLHF